MSYPIPLSSTGIYLEPQKIYSPKAIRNMGGYETQFKSYEAYLAHDKSKVDVFGKAIQPKIFSWYLENYQRIIEDIRNFPGLKVHINAPYQELAKAVKRLFLIADLIVITPPPVFRTCDPPITPYGFSSSGFGMSPISINAWADSWVWFMLSAKPIIESGFATFVPQWGDAYRWQINPNFPKEFPPNFHDGWIRKEWLLNNEGKWITEIHDAGQNLSGASVFDQAFNDFLISSLAGEMIFDAKTLHLFDLRDDKILMPNILTSSVNALDVIAREATSSILKFDLPFIDGVEFSTLAKIRKDYPDAFSAMTDTLKTAIEEISRVPVDRLPLSIRRVQKEIVDDGIDRVNRKFKFIEKLSLFKLGTAFVGITTAMVNPLLGSPINDMLVNITGTASLVQLISAYVDYLKASTDLREDSMWMLWMLMKRGISREIKQKRNH